jgi:hypothetical protein
LWAWSYGDPDQSHYRTWPLQTTVQRPFGSEVQ